MTKLTLLICMVYVSSCAPEYKLEANYSFQSALNVEHNITEIEQVEFKSNNNLDLGFYKGKIWIKLAIDNTDTYASYMVMMNDLVNRNYQFYKKDSTTNSLNLVSFVEDATRYDHRTFNSPKPNFKIDLAPNEKAIYIIATQSDGRVINATPKLLSLEAYQTDRNGTIIFNIIFFTTFFMLFLINIFQWSILKKNIYYYYGFYILSSSLFYLNIEGYLYGLGLTHHLVDHLIFVSIRIWVISLILFTSIFLELHLTKPCFHKKIKWILGIALACPTLYQFIFYNTSISHLHVTENIFGFIWMILLIVMISVSAKQKKSHVKYYFIAFSFLLIFVILGLIDSHTTILPGDPSFYFKIGTIIELIGFSYFITLIIKSDLKKAIIIEQELIQNKKKLEDTSNQLKSIRDETPIKASIEKTDLLSIFKLLESTLTNENEWIEFKSKFEELSPNFLVSLNQSHPNLTKSEIRLLILIRIGFTQKEIAEILNIAPDSVKKAKQRVRKKLDLSKSIRLTEYLGSFT